MEIEKIKITENRYIGPEEPVFIVAEVGQNHNGEMEIAKKLIDTAVAAGVDAVKFTKRTVEDILTKKALNQPYIGPQSFGKTYGEHRRKLELSPEQHHELAQYCKEKGIIYFSSVCDPKSADLMEEIGVPLYKIASRDLVNLPLLEYVAQKGKPVILSTGMSTMEEIEEAVNLILKFNKQLILMQCTSAYPCDYSHVNLRVIETLRRKFKLNVGYSGHTIGIAMPIVAVALGAVVIEKHITLARYMKGTDHACSLEPQGLMKVVRDIRNTEKALGNGVKKIYPEEWEVRKKLGKSIVARKDIPKGTVITRDMLTVKGPGIGLPPTHMSQLIGKRAKFDLSEDHIFSFEDVE